MTSSNALKLRILIACEESQRVCIAMRELGHDAFSCDILPCSGGHPEWHIQDDVLKHLDDGWDLMIAHPPCTYFSNAGMCNLTRKNSDDEYRRKRKELTLKSFDFVMALYNANIPKIAIENPVGYLNTHWRKPDQIIHPYQFGHSVNKKTCFWLKNLPLLKPTNIVDKDITVIWDGTGKKISKWYKDTLKFANGNLKEVSRIRSQTFEGVARAMAEQWTTKEVKSGCDANDDGIPPTTKVMGILPKVL